MAERRRDERCHERQQVVVHEAGVPHGRAAGRHDGGHQAVGLREGGVRHAQALGHHSVQRRVVEDHHRVSVLGKPVAGNGGRRARGQEGQDEVVGGRNPPGRAPRKCKWTCST